MKQVNYTYYPHVKNIICFSYSQCFDDFEAFYNRVIHLWCFYQLFVSLDAFLEFWVFKMFSSAARDV